MDMGDGGRQGISGVAWRHLREAQDDLHHLSDLMFLSASTSGDRLLDRGRGVLCDVHARAGRRDSATLPVHAMDEEHMATADAAIRKGIEYLRTTQNEDGSWTPEPGPGVIVLETFEEATVGTVPAEWDDYVGWVVNNDQNLPDRPVHALVSDARAQFLAGARALGATLDALPISGEGLFDGVYLDDRLRVGQNLNGGGARIVQVRVE